MVGEEWGRRERWEWWEREGRSRHEGTGGRKGGGGVHGGSGVVQVGVVVVGEGSWEKGGTWYKMAMAITDTGTGGWG